MSGEPGLGGWVPRGAVDLRSPATAVSCCSQFGAEERGSVERSFASLLPGPGPHLYQHLDGTWPRPGQWGQREPGGCGQCGQQPSHAEPGHCPWKYRSPPSKRDVMVCFGDGVCASMWNGSEAFQGEAGGLWGRGSNRGTDGQDGTWWRPPLVKWGWSELCPQHRRPFCSPEAATAPLAILVLGPAGASTAH